MEEDYNNKLISLALFLLIGFIILSIFLRIKEYVDEASYQATWLSRIKEELEEEEKEDATEEKIYSETTGEKKQASDERTEELGIDAKETGTEVTA